jgi:hypothetical protein
MDEKLNELLHTVRRSAAGAACGVCRKTGELVSAVRLRQRIAELEREEEARLAEAGRMVYATHTGTPTPTEALLEKLREIDILKAELASLRREDGRCAACGAVIPEGDRFCRACGRRL